MITQDYVLKFEGNWIGTSVRVIKADIEMSSGHHETSYDVASYQHSGPRSGIISGGDSLLFSDHPYYMHESDADTPITDGVKAINETNFNTVSLVDGPYHGRNLQTDSLHYEFNRDFVKAYELENGDMAYFVSDPQGFAIDDSFSGQFDSWVWQDETEQDADRDTDQASGGDWVAHTFNNTHNLTSLSPTYCMIEDIAKGRPVTEYHSEDGTTLWNPSMYACQEREPGTVAKVYTHFINGNGVEVSFDSLRKSAKDILYVREQHKQGSEPLLTVNDALGMLNSARYQDIKKELSQRYNWSKPYNILK